jgi:hypothetical protein
VVDKLDRGVILVGPVTKARCEVIFARHARPPEMRLRARLSRARLVSGEGGRPLRFANKGDCLCCIPDTIR